MRMRKKKNLIPRMERCGACLVTEPYNMPGKWRDLMPGARELRLELGCGKGRFTAQTAAANRSGHGGIAQDRRNGHCSV